MTSIVVTPPAGEPVTVADMRAHLRLTGPDEDAILAEFLVAARHHVERSTRRALITQAWRLYLDAWPDGRIVRLPVAPVQSVDQITVFASDGIGQALDAGDWTLERGGEPVRLRIKPGAGGPSAGLNGVEIDFTAGYGAAASDVPASYRQAIRLLAAHWFEHREAGMDTAMASLPHGLDRLLSTVRVPLL